jgi:hypothetical protein
MSRVFSKKNDKEAKAEPAKVTTQPLQLAQDKTRVVTPRQPLPPALLLRKQAAAAKKVAASPKAPATTGLGLQLAPGVEVKKEFPGKRLPSVYTPLFIVQSSLSLICSVAAKPDGPLGSVTLSKDEVSVELGKLAGSFGISKSNKSLKDVGFTSTFPGINKMSAQSISVSWPSVTWSSKLNLQPLIFNGFTVTGDITVQLKITIIPRQQPPPATQRVPSFEELPRWQQLVFKYGEATAIAVIAGEILGAILMAVAKTASAPFIFIAPELFFPDKGGMGGPGMSA